MSKNILMTLCAMILAIAGCGGPAVGGAGGTGGGDAGASTELTATLDLPAVTLAPGEEVYKCQNFANPFGTDVEVRAFASHTESAHHLILFYLPGAANEPMADCSGLEFAATPYGTQTPDDALAFPHGVAAALAMGTGLRVQVHYLNTSTAPIVARASVTLHLAPAGSVTQHAGIMVVPNVSFNVPPHAAAEAIEDCLLPQDMHVTRAESHMHRHGTAFSAAIAGMPIIETSTWSEPAPSDFAPPLVFHAGDPLRFSCAYQNDGNQPLTFGQSAMTDEMCVFSVAFYPAPLEGTITASACQASQQ